MLRGKSHDDMFKLINRDMNVLNELIKLGSSQSGIMNAITDRIFEAFERGPMVALREQFCLKSAVEKDLMKA